MISNHLRKPNTELSENKSALDKLAFTSAEKWTKLPESFNPVKEAHVTLKLKEADDQETYILATDSSDNRKEDYDTFRFFTERNGELITTLTGNEWGEMSIPHKKNEAIGFHFKLKDLDPKLKDVKLYRTAVNSAIVHGPKGFQKDIASEFGFIPAAYDDDGLEEGWITRKEYEEIQARFAKWTTDVSLHIKEKYSPDILFFYYPQIDHEEHKYLLVDPKQRGYTKKRSTEFMSYITWSYKLADHTIGNVLDKMDDHDRLLIVSDHGMEPVHTMIAPNHELEKAGLLILDKDGKVDSKKSKAFAVASGSIAHVYINLEGREKGGIVSEDEFSEVQSEVLDVFTDFKANQPPLMNRLQYLYYRWSENFHDEDELSIFDVLIGKKQSPFEKVVIADKEDEELDILKHEQAGDVLLIAKQGYYIGQDDFGSSVKIADERGNHGGDPERIALRPILYVMGGNYSEKEITEEVSTLDIAPTLYELMGIDRPAFMDGKFIEAMIERKVN